MFGEEDQAREAQKLRSRELSWKARNETIRELKGVVTVLLEKAKRDPATDLEEFDVFDRAVDN